MVTPRDLELKTKSPHMQIIIKNLHEKKHLFGQRLAQLLLVGPTQSYTQQSGLYKALTYCKSISKSGT